VHRAQGAVNAIAKPTSLMKVLDDLTPQPAMPHLTVLPPVSMPVAMTRVAESNSTDSVI
jgi:hypothetical protein